MPEPEDFYTSAQIDEQIEALLQGREMPERDQRMADDLQAILNNEHENARSLHLVQQKLQTHMYGATTPKVIPISQKQQQGRTVVMQKPVQAQNPHTRLSFVRLWTTLAAILVIGSLVGSMLLILNLRHQANTSETNPNHNSAISSTSTAAPAWPEGHIIYTSPKVSMTLPLAWSPDGKRVATAINLTTVQSWDVQSGKNVVTYAVAQNSNRPGSITYNAVENVVWSPDGSKLLVAENHTIYLFEASTARLIHTFQPVTNSTANTAVIAPLTLQGNAPQTLPLSVTMPFSSSDIFNNAIWSPNGQYIAAAYNGGVGPSLQDSIDIWEASSGKLVKTLHGFTENIQSVKWSAQEQRLAALGYDGITSTVVVWDTTTWAIIKRYPHIGAFDWSPQGTHLALVEVNAEGITTNSVRIVDADTGKDVQQITDAQAEYILNAHWSPDGTRLALETQKAGSVGLMQISIWNIANSTNLYTFPQGGVYEASWSPDSKYIACGQTKQMLKGNKREYYMLMLIWVA